MISHILPLTPGLRCTRAAVSPRIADVMVCPTTIGREREIESFHRLIDEVQSGRGTTVLVTGEAGIGKSRLVAEARRRASGLGMRVLQGAAFEHSAAPALEELSYHSYAAGAWDK